jgi:hypothetical protein
MSMKNSNDTIGDRTRDLPACSVVSQPTVPLRATNCYIVGDIFGEVVVPVLRVKKFQTKVSNFRFLPLCSWDPRSSGLLHVLSWFVSDVLGQHMSPVRKFFFLEILFENGTDMLCQKVGNKNISASHQVRRAKILKDLNFKYFNNYILRNKWEHKRFWTDW